MIHPSRLRWVFGVASVLLVSVAVPAAHADVSDANRTAAEALFRDARRLMSAGNYAEACPKLADSQRLDPGVGTLLNLGLCYKQMGRTASAWSAYREAADTAQRAGQSDRMDVAQKEASALEPLLAKLTLRVSAAAATAGVEIKLDGASMPRSLWDMPMPVDPGEHLVEATATGKLPWSQKIKVGDQANQTLEVPALADAPVTAAPEAPKAAPRGTETQPLAPAPEAGGMSGQQTAAVIVAGVGLAGVVVGSVFGLSAMSSLGDSTAECSSRDVCTSSGVELRDKAGSQATVATVGLSVGLVAIAGATVLWFTGYPSKESKTPPAARSVEVGATVGAGSIPWGVTVRSQW
jgi:hypothetical protein